MTPLSVTVSSTLIMRIHVGLIVILPRTQPGLRVFIIILNYVHIDLTIYDTTRIDHLIYVSKVLSL